jgi:hypothetical protein
MGVVAHKIDRATVLCDETSTACNDRLASPCGVIVLGSTNANLSARMRALAGNLPRMMAPRFNRSASMNGFRIRGLPAHDFSDLFRLSDDELKHRHARRMVAQDAGYPCRVSLTDATPGDAVILVNYEHHRVDSPYRSSFAIFVREGEQQFDAVNQVPEQLRKRMLALRGYDSAGMLRKAELVDGQDLEDGLAAMFVDGAVAYVHAHFAKHGCYAALIERRQSQASQG